MKKLQFLCLFALLAGLAGCSKSKEVDDNPQPAPEPSNPTIELANEALKSLTFPAEGGEQTVAFTVSAEWQAAAADGAWCAVSPAAGVAGQATFKVMVPPTELTEVRTTTVTIQAGTTTLPISVSQEGQDSIEVEGADGQDGAAKALHFAAEGGSEAVSFTVSGDWTAAVAAVAQDWCSVTPESGAAGKSTITVTAQPNDSTAERTTTVQLRCGTATVTIAVTQDGLDNMGDSNKIYYTGVEFSLVSFSPSDFGGAKLIDCIYEDGAGVLIFDRPVTIIGAQTFSRAGLKSITLPNSVTEIGDLAFYYCNSLTSITLPEGLSAIGRMAFDNCRALTSITLPNSLTEIGEAAFSLCTSLTSITIPNNITEISYQAFYSCSSLTSITLPDGVTSIGGSAFRSCENLTSIKLPDKLTSIGDNAFSSTGLTSITIPEGVTSIGGSAFRYCRALTSITLPNSLTEIGNWAFSSCRNLTNITIPEGVTSIGDWTFDGCDSLTSITIPDSVTSIGDWAFSNCSSLTSITLPNNLISIGASAFCNCKALTSLTIPENVAEIGNAFIGTTIQSLYCKPAVPPAITSYRDGTDKSLWIYSATRIYVPRNSVDAYKAADIWNDHADKIVGYDF